MLAAKQAEGQWGEGHEGQTEREAQTASALPSGYHDGNVSQAPEWGLLPSWV